MDRNSLQEEEGPAQRLIVARILCASEVFAGWPAEAIGALLPFARLGRYRRGDQLNPHDPRAREVVLIGAGFIDVSMTTARGRSFLLGIFGPNHILGILRLLPDTPAPYDYRVREDALVVQLASDPLLDVIEREPALWRSVSHMVLRQYRTALLTLINRRIGASRARVAMVLDNLAELHGVEIAGGIRLRVRVTQDDLAAMLSTTRQTVNKELRALEAAGIVAVDYTTLTIRDRPALRRCSEAPN